jgi:hypothetical protein
MARPDFRQGFSVWTIEPMPLGGLLSARVSARRIVLRGQWLFEIGFLSAVFLVDLQPFLCNFQWLF